MSRLLLAGALAAADWSMYLRHASWGREGAEMGELNAEMGDLKAEMGELKAEKRELKAEMGELKAEMRELKAEMGELKAEKRLPRHQRWGAWGIRARRRARAGRGQGAYDGPRLEEHGL